LFFNSHENIFIIPQTKSFLDIRDLKDLKRLLMLGDISRDYTKKKVVEMKLDFFLK